MAECLGCEKAIEHRADHRIVADRFSDKIYFLCLACREALETGRAVMAMKHAEILERGYTDWAYGDQDGYVKFGKTPMEALKVKP